MDDILNKTIEKPLPENFGLTYNQVYIYLKEIKYANNYNANITSKTGIYVFASYAIIIYLCFDKALTSIVEFTQLKINDLFGEGLIEITLDYLLSSLIVILFFYIAYLLLALYVKIVNFLILKFFGTSYKKNEIIEAYLLLEEKWKEQNKIK
jgi:hypothetical protein